MAATAADVARWMMEQVGQGDLYQEDAVWAIKDRFGEEFVYENDNGNLAIAKPVLAAFRKMSEVTVVWEKGARCWRKRTSYDPPGRQAD